MSTKDADELQPTPARTVDGRLPGRRGQQTRRRLLETTSEMLLNDGFRSLAVVDIAREAGVSPGTFYQYFPDVESAILFIADHVADTGSERLTALVSSIDLDGDVRAGAEALANGYLELWQRYDYVLRVLDLGAAEGDRRFQARRTQMLGGPTEALRTLLESRQPVPGKAAADPAASAAVVTSMLSHVAAHRHGIGEWGVDRADLVDAMAQIIATVLAPSA